MTAEKLEPLRLLAAGSLRRAFGELIPIFEARERIAIDASFGPAGLLRARIEAGDPFDVFASANIAHPHRLHELGLCEEPRHFATNGYCAIVRRSLAIKTSGLISAMLDPGIHVATSTPGADPSGDYAEMVFDRIELERPGAGRVMRSKARRLLGGEIASNVPPGRAPAEWLIATGQADIVLGYRSGAVAGVDEALAVIDLPPNWNIVAYYTGAVRNEASSQARRLLGFLRSSVAQAVMRRNGFRPPVRLAADDR